MKRRIRIGSRESKLAVIQAEIVRDCIQKSHPEMQVEIITMKTTGDKILDQSLQLIGGKGLFIKELDQALVEERIDVSVHSLKDMPMCVSQELPILAYTRREDPRDVLIYKPGRDAIPKHGIIGSSSARRILQLQKLYPDSTFQGIRGNVQTRLRKLEMESYDGTVLAAAGLCRLGMQEVIGRIFQVEEVIPAAGQGILAVQGRAREDHSYLECLKDRGSMVAALTERAFVKALDGGCSSPIAAFAQVKGEQIHLTGLYYNEESGRQVTGSMVGNVGSEIKLGEQLAWKLKRM